MMLQEKYDMCHYMCYNKRKASILLYLRQKAILELQSQDSWSSSKTVSVCEKWMRLYKVTNTLHELKYCTSKNDE